MTNVTLNDAQAVTGIYANPQSFTVEISDDDPRINAFLNPPTHIPQSVTMRQARLALLGAGLLDTVETAIAGAGPAAKIEWDYATEVQSASGLVPAMATALGLTDAQIDALFVTAATL